VSLRTRTIAVDPDAPEPAALAEAAAIVRRGGLVAFATETVYGLGADATNPEAVARIFEAKGRPAFNPLIVHSDRVVSARACVAKWPADADVLERSFWPGPLTLVLTRAEIIPDIVTAGGDTVGVRIPNHTVARRLIELAGRPIAAPSANRSTGISPSRAEHVLKDLDGKIDLVLDSGPSGGIESTVLDLTARPPRVLRPGTITIAQLSEALGIEVLGPSAGTDDSTAPSSPGQLAVHYAPRTPAFRVDRARFQGLPGAGRWGLIAIGPPVVVPRVHAPSRHLSFEEPKQAEAGLYEALHALDLGGFDFLIVVPPPDEPRWLAIRDRIQRATRPWPEPDV
jgi:L-threonylcarbamoyladenylate synthase